MGWRSNAFSGKQLTGPETVETTGLAAPLTLSCRFPWRRSAEAVFRCARFDVLH